MAEINGTDGDDQLIGGVGGDTLLGGAGNDTLDGSAAFTFAAYYTSASPDYSLGLADMAQPLDRP